MEQYHVTVNKSPFRPERHVGREGVYPHSFETSELDRGEWCTSLPGRFTPQAKRAGTH